MAQELSDVRKQLIEMQEQTVMDSIKKSLADAGQKAETRFSEMKESFLETKQSILPMVAEKEYQYGAEAFEAFQSTDKASWMLLVAV